MGNCHSKHNLVSAQPEEQEEESLSEETTELILTYEYLQRRRYSYPTVNIRPQRRERTLTE